MKLLQKAGMQLCKECATPMASRIHRFIEDPLYSDPTYYRSLVGALQYVTITCTDLAFAVNNACQYM